ncbi:hypothetical protein ACVGVM_23830 [Pseudonocardia bannensis]|uniref:Secreted protein n=1 Tax=Pseudonocardia bannensis TaxID=630973 RepID=A0A848DLH6_9PSEU|nr:hypothetical protein [Pseudonocardia bannensis]NMH93620.1 hypothetical protein [Pseudonocardia bannensis]
MNTAIRLTGYAAALALVFGTAWGIGSAVGPAVAPTAAAGTGGAAAHGHGTASPGGTAADGHAHDHGAGSEPSLGLASTQAGYTFVPENTSFEVGRTAEFAFRITGSDGAPVTAFDVEHDKRLHLVVIRRDAAGFQHLHPALGPDGVWRTPLTLPGGGVWRAYADFVPTGGPALTLGTDLFVPGGFVPFTHAPSRVAEVDGYQVRLDGLLTTGGPARVFATISRGGAPVTDLEPHLGAFGHLVALRQGDLAYLHVHPDAAMPAPTDRSGPGIAFTAEIPSAGGYRLFLDFQHGGIVHTAEFTVSAPEGKQ